MGFLTFLLFQGVYKLMQKCKFGEIHTLKMNDNKWRQVEETFRMQKSKERAESWADTRALSFLYYPIESSN